MRISSETAKAINDQIAYEASATQTMLQSDRGVKELDMMEVQRSFLNKLLRRIHIC